MNVDFRRVLDSFSDAVVAADSDGGIVYVNRAAEAMLGWPTGTLVGHTLVELVPERMRPEHSAGFGRYVKTREARLIGRPVRVPALCHSGQELDVELTLADLSGPDGDLFVASLRDITERVELERQLTVTRYLSAAARASARLTSRLDLAEVLQTVVDTLEQEFDAALARIWILDPETGELHLKASAGLSTATDTSSRAVIPVDSYPYKVGVIARTRQPFVLNGLLGDPDFEQAWVEREGLRAVAGFPLLIGGDLRGVFIYFSRRELQPEVIEVLETFAAMVSTCINDVQLLMREQEAREEADSSRRVAESQSANLQLANEELNTQHEEMQQITEELQLANEELQRRQEELEEHEEALRDEQGKARFLAEASLVLSSSLEQQSTLETLARLAVPEFGDWCAIDLAEDDGALRRVAVAHVDPEKVRLVWELHRRYPPRPEDPHGPPNVLTSGRAELYGEITDALLMGVAHDAEHLRLLRELGLVSALCVPLPARDRVLGVLTLASAETGCHYGPAELSFAQELARRAALAVDNARLFREVQEADRQKDRFLAMLAHELRNPLSAISNAAHVLERLELEPAAARRLTLIVNRQAGNLSRMVDDLLDIARITRGSVELRKELVELRSVLGRSIESAKPLIEARGHDLSVALGGEPLRLLADGTRLEQVFVNLLNNAAKYTDPFGRLSLSVETEGLREGETERVPTAVVRVRDTGVGIAGELLPRIFDLFTQGDQTLARSTGGLGVGLTLVKSLVEMHGGTVEARSEGIGKGSEFEVRLPVLREAQRRVVREPAAAGGSASLRVLVVDDNPDSAETLADLLRLWEHTAEVAYDGAEALDKAARFRPEVVLCDLGLPGMDGCDVAAALRREPGTEHTRIIAVTGYGGPEVVDRCRAAGFDLHLTKPVDPAALRDALTPPR